MRLEIIHTKPKGLAALWPGQPGPFSHTGYREGVRDA